MLIDWFTVIAQVINFLVLVLLLRRFLYKPVLQAIENREQKIKDQLQEADEHMEEAKEEKSRFEKKNRELEKDRDNILEEAREEAEKHRKALLEEARKEAKALQEQLEEELKEERKELQHELQQRIKQQVFDISQKALKDLASESLEENIIRVFVQRLESLPDKQKEQLQKSLKDHAGKLMVKSAFTLRDSDKEQLEQKVKTLTQQSVPLEFEVAEEKIGGIEIHAGGFKLSWSISDYLTSFEKTLDEVLNKSGSPKSIPENEVTEQQS